MSPRSAKRLVNVFKLLKIIWYHRGDHREPSPEVKQGMMFLLALSARQLPVTQIDIHRHRCREEQCRHGTGNDQVAESSGTERHAGDEHTPAGSVLPTRLRLARIRDQVFAVEEARELAGRYGVSRRVPVLILELVE